MTAFFNFEKHGSFLLRKKKYFFSAAKKYFRENPGAVFVVGFQVLLLSCAGLLALGNSSLAEEVANVAYFLLVAGVVLYLYSSFQNRKKHDDLA